MKKKVEMISFVDKSGKVVFSVPGDTTIEQWVKMGLPKIHLVSKFKPWKENEVRNKPI